MHQTLIRLGQRIASLAEIAATQIAGIVEDMAPGLVAAEPGLGTLSAAQILLSWSHAGRIRSEQAFAMLSGTAPAGSAATRRSSSCGGRTGSSSSRSWPSRPLARQTLPGEQVRIFKPTGVGVGSCTAGRSWSELV
jgi:transposase